MGSKKVDRLSMLPEEILSIILSLMPTKFAARTSILCKRWRYSWMFVTNLDFDDIYSNRDLDSFTKFMDRVLNYCKSSQLKLFRLHLRHTSVPESLVTKWIDKVVDLNVREFDIHLLSWFEFPPSLFTCKTLTKLRLAPRNYYIDWEEPYTVNLPCLKTLDLVVFTMLPSAIAFKIFSGCPVLETLSLEVQWKNDEEDYIFNIPTLKHLNLRIESLPFISKLVLNVPNLEYLFVGGYLCLFIVMEDVSSLVEASVSFEDVLSGHNGHLWIEFFKGLNGVKSFSVQNYRFLDSEIPFSSPFPIFANLKQLELKGFWESELILQFLESSPQLEHLCIENPYLFIKLEEYSWIEPKLVPGCMLNKLTTIKFLKSDGEKRDIEFVEYMLGNATVLKTITITWYNLRIEEEKRLGAQFLKAPRASPHCQIIFEL